MVQAFAMDQHVGGYLLLMTNHPPRVRAIRDYPVKVLPPLAIGMRKAQVGYRLLTSSEMSSADSSGIPARGFDNHDHAHSTQMIEGGLRGGASGIAAG
jgi:hypothetical protein